MKSMKSKTLLIIVLVLVAGLYVSDRIFLQQRGIASFTGAVRGSVTKTYFDLTELPESEFNVAYKTALVAGLEVQKSAEAVGLAWGHFLTSNDSGGKVYACEKYPRFEMELRAEGIANSGEIPVLWVRGPCLGSDDGKKILPLTIPLANLMARLRSNPELKIPIGTSGEFYTITAENLYGPGARYWNVVNVRLSNQTESLSVDGYEIISLLDQALTLDFAVTQ